MTASSLESPMAAVSNTVVMPSCEATAHSSPDGEKAVAKQPSLSGSGAGVISYFVKNFHL